MKPKDRSSAISQEWEAQLSQAGYRLTQPRRVILDIIAGSSRPLTPMEIFTMARERHANIGLVTVYRTVEKLEELHLVSHVHHVGQCQTVFRGTYEHQHLIICTHCGQSRYFDGCDSEAEFDQVGDQLGYRVTGHWLQLAGECEDCQQQITIRK